MVHLFTNFVYYY